jgi:O-antigen/teichoic acid export membrane protein
VRAASFSEGIRFFGLRVAVAGVVFATEIVLARAFGAEGRGHLALLLLVPAFAGLVAGGGLDLALNQSIQGRRIPPGRAFTAAISLAVPTTVLVLLALLVADGALIERLTGSLPSRFDALARTALWLVPIEVAFLLVGMLAQSVGRPTLFASMRIVRRGGLLAACVAVLFVEGSAVERVGLVVWGAIVAGTVSVAWGAVSTRVGLGTTHDADAPGSGSEWRETAWLASVAWPGRVAERFQSRIAILVGGALLVGPTALGWLALAFGLADVLLLFSNSIAAVLWSRGATPTDHHRGLRLMSAAGVVGGAALVALSPWVVPLVFGEEFREAVGALAFAVPGTWAFAMIQSGAPRLTQARQQARLSVATVLGFSVSVGACVLGFTGVAAGSAGSGFTLPVDVAARTGALGQSIGGLVAAALVLSRIRALDGVEWRDLLVPHAGDLAAFRKALARGRGPAGRGG